MQIQLPYVRDSATVNWMRNQFESIDSSINRTVYDDIIYQSLVPVDSNLDPFAQTIRYFYADEHGRANWMNLNSDDMPIATTSRGTNTVDVHSAGIGYAWGWEEIQVAQRLGRDLASEDAASARRAAEEMCQEVAFVGAPTKGFNGLVNAPGVTVTPAPVGNWGNPATPWETISQEFNLLVLSVAQQTNQGVMADTVLLPLNVLQALASRVIPDTGGKTLLQILQASNPYTVQTGRPLTIRGLNQLNPASLENPSGVLAQSRAIAYRRHPDVLKMYVPMPHQFLGVFQTNIMRFEVPGVMRLGGVNVKRPKEMSYWDGV